MEPIQQAKPTFGAMILTFLFNAFLLIDVDKYTKYASAISLTLMCLYYAKQLFFPNWLAKKKVKPNTKTFSKN